jgi:segregation and condensation protein B
MPTLTAAIESILFIHGEPIEIKKLTALLVKTVADVDQAGVEAALAALKESLEKDPDRGIALARQGSSVQLVTKEKTAAATDSLVRGELAAPLTPAALETLALIAYAGPVAKSIVEYVRGVNSSFILRTLMIRGLVERVPDRERENSYRYRASLDLLRHLGLTEQALLPEYERLRGLVAALESQPTPLAAEKTN